MSTKSLHCQIQGKLARFAALNLQYAASDEFGDWRGYCVANEPSSSTVQPAGNPISFSHSVQVKFLAT